MKRVGEVIKTVSKRARTAAAGTGLPEWLAPTVATRYLDRVHEHPKVRFVPLVPRATTTLFAC